MAKNTELSMPMFLTVEQASKLSGIGVNRLRQLLDARQVEYITVGNRKLTTRESLLAYYDRAKVSVLS